MISVSYGPKPKFHNSGWKYGASLYNRPSSFVCLASRHFDVGIAGGGAAGLTAAYFAAKEGLNVCIIEKMEECGKKILVSGGTRCNILPRAFDLSDFETSMPLTGQSKQGLKSVFSRWSLEECKNWLENDIGIEIELDEKTSKYFPVSNSAKEVRNKLLQACLESNATIMYGCDLQRIERISIRDGDGIGWKCSFKDDSVDEIICKRLIMATGGCSFPSLGTVGDGYEMLKVVGHSTCPANPYPALTPLLGRSPGDQELSGISLTDVNLSVRLREQEPSDVSPEKKKKKKKKARIESSKRHDFLITHRGFSGPSVMDMSHHLVMAMDQGLDVPDLEISWIQDKDERTWERMMQQPSDFGLSSKQKLSGALNRVGIPARLSKALCSESNIPEDRILAELRKEERISIIRNLTAYKLHITGHEGFPKAEVTAGGVPLSEIDCGSMESRIHPGLYVIGELLDVFGRIGGFNFLLAWSTGRLAGKSAAQSLLL